MPDARWGEPFCVMTDDGNECTASVSDDPGVNCGRPARWQIEAVGWTGRGDAPPITDDAPEEHACDDHLVELLNGLTGGG